MWYDLFALFYDRALEHHYAPFRPAALDALRLTEGATVLDLPCGTGQSLDGLVERVGESGAVLGVDASAGMLKKAQKRADREGWRQVRLRQATAAEVDGAMLEAVLGSPQVDGLLCALGLTALPDWETTAERLMALVRPGGRIVLFDVVAAERTRQTKAVERIARADLSREVWRVLDRACDDVERTILPADPATFGGELYVASGTRRDDQDEA